MSDESKNKKKFNSGKGSKKLNQILAIILVAIILFGTGFYTGLTKPWEKIASAGDTVVEDKYTLTISTLEEVVQPASDLITSRYNYKDADTYENYKQLFGKKVPLTTDKVVFIYKGIVSVGIDLAEVQYNIDNENGIINIKLPDVGIITNEIDNSSFEFPFESDSVFNNTGMSDYTELLATLKEQKAEEVTNNTEFMDEARQNTENVLESFLTVSDATKDYKVIFE